MARGIHRVGGLAGLILAALAYFFHVGSGAGTSTKYDSGSPRSAPSGAGMLSDFSGPVVSVHDGDTIQVRYLDKNVKIRLWGVDCPEVSPAQDCGQDARIFANEMVMGKTVRVEVHDRDKYGRVVGEVFVGDKSLNAALVESGWAWAYRHYTLKFAALEELAHARHIGLWAHPNPEPPWDFRRETK